MKIAILIAIACLTAADLALDLKEQQSVLHLVGEIGILVITLTALSILILQLHQERTIIVQLEGELEHCQLTIGAMKQALREARHDYSKIIQKQLESWLLSHSEQRVAWLLLKGFSLKEIALLRNTSERTVRTQASSIYTKANVLGRHEFSGRFLEDLLNT